MYNNKRGGSGGFKGGKKSFGGDRGGFGGESRGFGGPRQMHDATCSSCGNSCQVPFRPNGKKPIFCVNCFKRDGEAPRGASQDRRPEYRSAPSGVAPSRNGGDANIAAQLQEINDKLDALIEAFMEEGDEDGDEEDGDEDEEEAEVKAKK